MDRQPDTTLENQENLVSTAKSIVRPQTFSIGS